MCISCSLHYFIGCRLFGFKFDSSFIFQTQRHLLCFSSLFSLSFLSFGPSPAGLFSSLSFFSFCSPAQPAVLLSRPLLSSTRPARPRPTASLLLFPLFSPLRAHGPLPRPGPTRSPPLLPRSLSGAWAPPVGPSFPAPDRDSTPSPASPSDLHHRIRLEPPRPGALGYPHLSRRTLCASSPKLQPPRALSLAAAPAAAAFAARASGRRRTAAQLPPAVDCRTRSISGGEEASRPCLSLPPALPRQHGLAGVFEPPLAVARPLRPISPPLNPLDRFLTLPSTSPSRSEPEPSRETRFRVKSGEPPPPLPRRRRPTAAPAPPRAASAPPPSDQDPAAHS
jgi:hypothetical protein